MSPRLNYLLGFILICGLLLTSVYLEIYKGILPCPLCTLQRLTFASIGLLFLLGVFFTSSRLICVVLNFLGSLLSIIGMLLAGRQIWLQHFPSADANECGVSLHYMMQVLPVNEVMQKILAGSAECTQRGSEFFFLNMAEWSFLWFLFFLLTFLWITRKQFKEKK